MSKVRLDLIWQHNNVLPYILNELRLKVEKITPVHAIYLFGSRSKTPFNDWGQLKGKDWDIIMVCNFPIINTGVLTIAKGYYIDLSIVTKNNLEKMMAHQQYIELYPKNTLTQKTE